MRELAPSDRHALAFIFSRLGDDSRYQRFLGVKHRLDPAELAYYTTVDQWHHGALIAYAVRPRAPIAVARYVRTHEFDAAEIAVEVVDGLQRSGVATSLLQELRERAVRAGIARFAATMWRGNRGAFALARRIGPVTITGSYGEAVECSIDLGARWPPRRS